MRPVLLLEMNEIPWRLLDAYRSDKAYPNIERFFRASKTYTTVAVDSGELSPWVTWPTLHRGMSNDKHGILNLGQDPATFGGKPIWKEFVEQGHAIGICGSMQSWPPIDPGPGGFYIPDTFAHDEAAFPAYVEVFQRFNLAQVKQNGRVLDKRPNFGRDAMKILRLIPKLGISLSTLCSLAAQLVAERINPDILARRPVFQSILLWDIFKSLYRPGNPPAFSTFFSNHVAGLMHRYWHHVFPGDFGEKYRDSRLAHKGTMDFAMKVLDGILKDVIAFQSANAELIVGFATSMGQAAIERNEHEGYEASIADLDRFLGVMNMRQSEYRPLLAMVPQAAVEILNEQRRAYLKNQIEKCVTASGHSLFVVQEIGRSLSITVTTPRKSNIESGGFRIPGDGDGRMVDWDSAGIRMNMVEPGTAYHIPEGILAISGPGIACSDDRGELRADGIKDLLLRLAGLELSTPAVHRKNDLPIPSQNSLAN